VSTQQSAAILMHMRMGGGVGGEGWGGGDADAVHYDGSGANHEIDYKKRT
jgi:hypothetical protein